MSTNALAQSPAKQGSTVVTNARAAGPVAAVTIVTAAGSVIILADGIVANAALAQIQAPADGFVYER
jgi:hypothetical protein